MLKNKPLLLRLFNSLITTKFFILMRLDSILLTNVTGWGPTQDRLKGFKTGLRYTKDRVSIVSAYQHSKLIAPMVYKGTMDSGYFNTTMTKALLSLLP